jgi:hypothetical protein
VNDDARLATYAYSTPAGVGFTAPMRVATCAVLQGSLGRSYARESEPYQAHHSEGAASSRGNTTHAFFPDAGQFIDADSHRVAWS